MTPTSVRDRFESRLGKHYLVMPSSQSALPSPLGDRVLHSILLLTTVAPALAIAWGREDGQVIFILYREPKLMVAAVCTWLLVATVAWLRPAIVSRAELSTTLRQPVLLVIMTFLGYLATTGLWVRVSENHLYELSQYITLFPLLVILLTWARLDSAVPSIVLQGIVLSLAVVTVVGGVQWLGAFPALTPINPQIGAPHPSLMGYKNPAALAVLGQLFLLGYLVARTPSWGWRISGIGLLLLELAYLATLRSRTAYVALVLAAVYFVALRLLRQPSRKLLLQTLASVGLLGALFLAVLLTNHSARLRAASALEFIKNPSTYLDSDRGTYLRNTLEMVRHHSLGVGLGDWQTHYPVFRRYNRTLSFDDTFQVRRAHSDLVQFLGEAGWPGFLLWIILLALLIGSTARQHLTTGRLLPLFVSAQVVALASAMVSDYLIELPYNKFQFFLVVFLALTHHQDKDTADQPDRSRPPHRRLTALLLTVLALASLTYHTSLLRKVRLSATMTEVYTGALAQLSRDGRVEAATLERVLDLGRDFDAQIGLTKTLHKDYLALGHTALLLGKRDLAELFTEKSLTLHPYSPNAFRLMTRIVDDPQRTQVWEAAYKHVMDDAWQGFTAPYPNSNHNLW